MFEAFAAYSTREAGGNHDADLQALDHSDAMYRTIVETARDGVWIWDTDGRTVFTNQRMADMLGYTREEMLGMPVFAFMEGDDDRAIAKQEIGESREGQREFKVSAQGRKPSLGDSRDQCHEHGGRQL